MEHRIEDPQIPAHMVNQLQIIISPNLVQFYCRTSLLKILKISRFYIPKFLLLFVCEHQVFSSMSRFCARQHYNTKGPLV